jgi:hypothetical protein
MFSAYFAFTVSTFIGILVWYAPNWISKPYGTSRNNTKGQTPSLTFFFISGKKQLAQVHGGPSSTGGLM